MTAPASAPIIISGWSREQAAIHAVFGEHDGRVVLWRAELRDGKPAKVPYRPSGKARAMSNRPSTWGTFETAHATLAAGGFDGVGIMLGDLGDGRFLVGKDWDLCRNPITGEIVAWAMPQIERWPSYIEISPSGTGLKGYGIYTGVPMDGRKEITVEAPIPEGAEGSGHSLPEIGLYPGYDPRGPESKGRYFALTGMHLPGTPLELRDVTAAYVETQDEFKSATCRPKSGTKRAGRVVEIDMLLPAVDLPDSVKALLAADPEFAAAWESGAKIGPGADSSASGRDFSLAVWLAGNGVPDAEIAATLRAYPHGQIGSGRVQGRRAARRIARIISDIRAGAEPEDPRPVIRLAGGFLHAEVERAERELGKAGDVYQRGAMLARVAKVTDPSSGGIRRAADAAVITLFDRPTMRMKLTETIRFERFDRRSEEFVAVNCPGDHADALLASAGNWPTIPPLLGIVEAPTLRPDGSVLEVPGYDVRSGLYFADGGLRFPPVPLNPSRSDALAALDVLRWPFVDIPFKADADLSVALSCVMAGLTRRSLRAVPGYGYTAPKMASGKTLCATIVAYIATGRAPAMMSQGNDAESERKRLFSVLLEGAAIAVIDNVERTFASDALCSILTEPVFKDRVLGVSRTASAPTCTTWCVTGNNLTIAGDLTTRMLVSRIDPECERPEEREFKVNLHEEVPKRRAELAVAALTIIRAFIAAGSPRPKVPTFGRFEQWQDWCRFPLIWLDMADPCDTRSAVEGRDPVRERLTELGAAWASVFGADETTTADAVKEANKDLPLVREQKHDNLARLRAAMQEIASDGAGVNLRKLGWFISRHEGRIEDGMRFVRGEKRRAGALWKVEQIAKGAGFAGFAGFEQPSTRECHFPNSGKYERESDSYVETAAKNSQNPQNPQELAEAEIDL